MKKESFERGLDRILNEKETFLLSLVLLAHMTDDEKYKDISELIFLFDNYKGFKQFIKFYEGKDVAVPTVVEVKQALRLLDLFQKVYIDKRDFDASYEKLKFYELGLTKTYCKNELDKFKVYLEKEGSDVLKQLRRLSKLK